MKRKIYKLISSARQALFAIALVAMPSLTYSQTFAYTGSQQTVLLAPGPYKIQCWGADGGLGNINSGSVPNSQIAGGVGGYSTGTIVISSPTTWYIHVGEKGWDGFLNPTAPGGYNGGGNGSVASTHRGGGGGGATHVATAPGILSSLSGNQSAVLIVAGGGAGGGNQSIGGDGGGLNGIQPQSATQFSNRIAGGGGSQTAGGVCQSLGTGAGFGQGGTSTQNLAGGGGGGWYGGCTGENSTGGGGGSGYIGGVLGGTTAATGQTGFVTNPDALKNGYVIITLLCPVSASVANNPMCFGQSTNLSTNAASNIMWSHTSSTANQVVVSPSSTTSYTVTGQATSGCSTSIVLTVTVLPLPVISAVVSPTTLCVGNTATINAIGANTYTWSTGLSGSTTTMNPGVTTTFSVTATSVYGCINSNTVSVPVNSNSITVSSSSPVCIGGVATLMASGAMSYTWSTGSMFPSVPVSPTVLTNYVVTGTDVYGCVLSNVIALSPSPLPDVSISASKNIICKGETVVLTALGATTFTWNDGTVAPSLTRTLPADVPYYYSVTGTDATGCSKTVSITITAAKCLGLNEIDGLSLDLRVIPNPGTGLFNLQVNSVKDNLHMSVYNTLGMLIKSAPVVTGPNQLDLRAEKAGIYFIYIHNKGDNTTQVIKLINE